MSTRGREQRPWRTIRCVVEAKVPPSNRSTEKDLAYHVHEAFDVLEDQEGPFVSGLPMPRALHSNHHRVRPKVKAFGPVFRAEVKRPSERSSFEQLVIRALYAILMFTMPRTRLAREASKQLREDMAVFVEGPAKMSTR